MTQKFFAKKGFTLLELLVVISIIGILMTLGVVAFSTAQKKGRDAKRRGDVKAMQSAFEQYYSASTNSSYGVGCASMASTAYFPSGALPVDPKTGDDYDCDSSATGYCVCATLEDLTGGNANGRAGVACTYAAAGTDYCLSNLQ